MESVVEFASKAGFNRPFSATAFVQKFQTQSIRDAIASVKVEQFYNENHGILAVGHPTGPIQRLADGSYRQDYNVGSISQGLSGPPQIGNRLHVTIEIAGVRIFGTDDPSGTDEPYIVASVYALDPDVPMPSQTIKIGPDDIGSQDENAVFAKGRRIATDFYVPGDSEIRMNVQIYDVEMLGNAEDVKKKVSAGTQAAMAAGLAAVGAEIGAGAALISKVAGFLDSVGDAIGGVVADLLGDDLIDQKDFIVHPEYLRILFGLDGADPDSLERTSGSIPGETFNYPPLQLVVRGQTIRFPEDPSPEGRSWLFDRGPGKGTYRVYFRIKTA